MSKKRVAIITISHGENFGNRLQNYALQKVLTKLHVESLTIIHTPPKNYNKVTLKQKVQYWRCMDMAEVFADINRIIRRKTPFLRNKYLKKEKLKRSKFLEFVSENIVAINEKDYSSLNFDYVILGSDQIWNPYGDGKDEFYYQPQCEKDKLVPYAASFGVDSIPNEYVEFYKKMLSNFSMCSIREQEGVRIYEEITGNKGQLVLDPTLLISPDEWAEECNKDIQESVVAYFLGLKDHKIIRNIIRFSKDNKLPVKILSDSNAFDGFGPIEFISSIYNAKYVITDSYHCVLFSIIFGKPFAVLNRSRKNSVTMNSRIRTLCFELGISILYTNENEQLKFNVVKRDYYDRIIKGKIHESIQYLINCMRV